MRLGRFHTFDRTVSFLTRENTKITNVLLITRNKDEDKQKYNFYSTPGPWTGGISPVISHKPRVKKGSAPLPVQVLPRVPDQIDRPFSFSQLSNYVYPSPYIREYRNLVKLSHEPANSNRVRCSVCSYFFQFLVKL